MIYKKICLFFPLFLILLSCPTTHQLRDGEPGYKSHNPKWISETIIEKSDFIYSIGHSRPLETEDLSMDEAIADATEEFVRYCGVNVQVFDRSMEIYSKKEGKEFYSADLETQSIIRAKAFVSKTMMEDWYIRKKDDKFVVSILLKVPKDEFKRIVNERNLRLSLDILFYYETKDGRMRSLNEGDVLKTGDGYAIYVKPSDPCYLYIFQIDTLGKTFRLFPNSNFNTGINPIQPASEVWIPNQEQLFKLDEITGKELFYLFASLYPIEDFEGKNALNLNIQKIEKVIEINKMGVAGVKQKRHMEDVKPPTKNQNIIQVKKKLQAEGAFIYETWFWHK